MKINLQIVSTLSGIVIVSAIIVFASTPLFPVLPPTPYYLFLTGYFFSIASCGILIWATFLAIFNRHPEKIKKVSLGKKNEDWPAASSYYATIVKYDKAHQGIWMILENKRGQQWGFYKTQTQLVALDETNGIGLHTEPSGSHVLEQSTVYTGQNLLDGPVVVEGELVAESKPPYLNIKVIKPYYSHDASGA